MRIPLIDGCRDFHDDGRRQNWMMNMSEHISDHSPSGSLDSPSRTERPKKVVIKGVSKYFAKNRVLSDVDLEVFRGEFCVLLGPSGCGKSTLLRIIAGLERASRGKIFIDGRDVTDVPPGRRDVAMVFQNYAIYPHMTVFDNIAFPLKIRKLPKEEIRTRVSETAAMLQLDNLLERKPAQLSGGQRQRVAMGRAIVRNPAVFLFDEPLSNLDAKLRVAMRMEIAQLHRRLGATMIYVTHDQVEAMTLADRIAVIDSGIIRQIDTPEGLYHRPADLMVAGFLGVPSMNLIRGDLHAGPDERTMRFTAGSTEILVERRHKEGPAVAGIRPEHIIIHPEGKVRGVVEFIEDTGSDRYCHVRPAGGDILVVRAPQDASIRTRDEVHLIIDESRVHLFEE